MITGELKHKIDRLWETFWTGGITNPLDVVEQMTYLMFIHDLDATDNQRAKESALLGLPHESIFAGNITFGERTIPGEQLKWSVFHDLSADKMYSTVQEAEYPLQAFQRDCRYAIPCVVLLFVKDMVPFSCSCCSQLQL